MAGTSGVKAGQAYVELSLRDRMSKDLDAAKAKLESFSRGAAIAGGLLAGGGAGIIGGIGAGVSTFVELGGAIQEMGIRTGFTAEQLSELRYAADQAGVSVEGLETAAKGMAKFTFGLGKGGKGETHAANLLGLDRNAFLQADQMGRLEMLADGLSRIEDPAIKAALAQKVLGREGMKLLPMLAGGAEGLRKQREEAARLGLTISQIDADKADQLGDMWATIKQQGTAALFAIGAAVADYLIPLAQGVMEAGAAVIQFIRANQGLVVAVAAVGVALLIAGGALLALAAAGYAAIGVMGAFSALSGILAAVFSPIGLIVAGVLAIVAALVAGIAAWAAWTESGQSAMSRLWNGIKAFANVAKQTLGGVFDAALAGNWSLAWQVAIAGVSAYWARFVAGIYSAWQGVLGFFQDGWTNFKSWVAEAMLEAFGVFAQFINDAAAVFGAGPLINASATDQAKQTLAEDTNRELAANAQARADAAQPYWDAVARAEEKLAELRQRAADERSAKAMSTTPRALAMRDALAYGSASIAPKSGGGTLGTFSGAVAGLLGRSAPDVQANIEKNTAKTADLLEELVGNEEGMAFE